LRASIDPITLEVVRNALTEVAEEMNTNLIRTSYSPNIKERQDCSSALFDASGKMIAQAESIPVHLGAMPFSVEAVLDEFGTLSPGDVVVLNDPFRGGAHLPDITFVSPVFFEDRPVALVANRAHHADIGGSVPGSVAGDSTEIYQEGLRLPPIKLWKGGELDERLMELILANVRTPEERRGDLLAQRAANETGRKRFRELIERHGIDLLEDVIEEVFDYSERRMRKEIKSLPDGVYRYADFLDGDGSGEGKVKIAVEITIEGDDITFDYSDSSPAVQGPVNAVFAVTASATYFTIKGFTDPDIPPNEGCYRPVEIIASKGTVVHAQPPAPVVGGNLETSQRVVDTLIGALAQAVPEKGLGGCQGTMNNLTLGGIDPRSGSPYTLYETIGGGYGGRPNKDGVDGIHSHMTNTLNTPVEALEISYPLRVRRYELRQDSSGPGKWRGGMGIRREVQVVDHKARISLLSERRRLRPYGVEGGGGGAKGEDFKLNPDAGEREPIPAKGSTELNEGEIVSIRTPGGGGYGRSEERDRKLVEKDYREERISAKYAKEHYGYDFSAGGGE